MRILLAVVLSIAIPISVLAGDNPDKVIGIRENH
jgi:hypothetical protein